jgi:hypothetical protein
MDILLILAADVVLVEKDWYNDWDSPGYLWTMAGFAVVLALVLGAWAYESRYQAQRNAQRGVLKKDPKNAPKAEDEDGGDDAPAKED